MTKLFTLKKALEFYKDAVTPYQVHAPFAASIVKQIIYNKKDYYAYSDISNLRSWYGSSTQEIELTDLGAGSKNNKQKKTLSEIINGVASDTKKGKILFNLSRVFKPQSILELGTNLGVGTAYLSMGYPPANIHSLEGDHALVKQAFETFKYLKIKNVKITEGNFDDTLKPTCEKITKIDLAFLDGNHRYESTINYYKTIKEYLHPGSVVILDDIYWSDGMSKAWKEIKADSDVRLSMDLFQVGILFYDSKIQKEDLKLIPLSMKPWRNGVFG